MNRVFVTMSEDNIKKILSGEKTTTVRSKRASEQIGVSVGETSITTFGGVDFLITNKGFLTVDEAGGKEKMIKSEAFGENGPKYKQTENWLDGSGRLYVYEIRGVDELV